MVGKIISRGKKFLTEPQTSVLSAATIIMIMVVASRILGLVRQRTLAHFFAPDDLSLFFAAFRLPDLVFEVLVFGTFSSAFIPVFTKSLKKGGDTPWKIANSVINIGIILFLLFSILLGIGADFIYKLFAPGYSLRDRQTIVELTRVLFAAQSFFVISYVLTGVLESLRRFLIPALAPLFYNLGIILGTVFFVEKLDLLAPALGVIIGAFSHLIIQLPFVIKLGFRFRPRINIDDDLKMIGRLALPRIIELSFLQVSKLVELFFSSLISTASYTFYTFGNTLQLLPVGLFGTSIAKAALPTLTRLSDDHNKFEKTLFTALYDMSFLVLPIATVLIVLRIPIVRLVYGTDIFGWEATVQTGYVVSAFALGIVFQSGAALLARSFYALHDTKTPVIVSIISISIIILADFVFIKLFNLDVWGLALAFSIGAVIQAASLFYLILRKLGHRPVLKTISPIIKSGLAAAGSGLVMYLLLKIFDRSVWVKKLSFLGNIEATQFIPFERFVLDTRYTVNLLILTVFVSLIGVVVYLGLSILLGSDQVWSFFRLVKRILLIRKVAAIPPKEEEAISFPPEDSSS